MGIMDKLRSMKNAVTGGAAKVELEVVGTPAKGTSFPIRVTAAIGDADVKIDKVYVNVEGLETAEVDVEQRDEKKNTTEKRRVSQQAATYRNEIVLSGAQTLNAKQQYTWEGNVQLH